MGSTSIEWTDHSVNPIRARNRATGAVGHFCEKITPGCAHCYSSTWQHRFTSRGNGTGLDFLPVNRSKVELFLDDGVLRSVLKRRKPTKFFWCDMTDMFGEWVADRWIDRCFAIMSLTPQHTHQVLTKRPERMREYMALGRQGRVNDTHILNGGSPIWFRLDERKLAGPQWPLPNVWLGVSVEDQQRADERIPLLLQTPAAVRFLSVEPLLGPVDLSKYLACPGCGGSGVVIEHHDFCSEELSCACCGERPISLVIVGGESGHGARPMHPDWARSIRDQCQASGAAFFFKQWGEWAPGNDGAGGDLYARDRTRLKSGMFDYCGRWNDGGPNPFRQTMDRVGKKAAGRMLDGREWSEFPQPTEAAK